jgi:cytochrome P450
VLFNPTAYYRALREKAPVHYDHTLGMYVVSRHAELAEVLRNWEVFSLELGYHRMWGQGHLDELKQILDREGGGLTNVDPAKIHAWANAYMAQFSGLQSREEMLANAAQICELQRYIIELVREREANPGEDMISDLVTARLDGEGNPTLKFEEVVALARMQVKTAAREIACKLEDIRLAIPVEEIRYAPSIAMLAMKSPPLAFRRRTTAF